MWNLASRELNLLGCEEKRAPGLFGGGDGQVQRGLEATRGKVGASSSCLSPYPTLPSFGSLCTFQAQGAARPWHRTGSATVKTPGLTRRSLPEGSSRAARRLSGQRQENIPEEVAQALLSEEESWG